jgi:hypothetical protein
LMCMSSNEPTAFCSADEVAKSNDCIAEYSEKDECNLLKTGAECAPLCWCTNDHQTRLQEVMNMIPGCSDVECGDLISTWDWVFVGYAIFSEFLVWLSIFRNAQEDEMDNSLASLGLSCTRCPIALIAGVGCSLGKLYPIRYFCTSLLCSKLVHNAIMTLVAFPFDLVETYALMAIEVKEGDTRIGLGFKISNILASLAYLLYDTARTPFPGPGSVVLVVIACLCDCFLLSVEVITVCKISGKISPE